MTSQSRVQWPSTTPSCHNDNNNKTIFQSKTDHQQMHFCSYDLDLDPMTLIYEYDLDILFLSHGFQKLEHYRQIHRQMRPNALPITTPHLPAVIIIYK